MQSGHEESGHEVQDGGTQFHVGQNTSTPRQPTMWTDHSLNETVDYELVPVWPKEDEEVEPRTTKLFKVSKESKEFLGLCFSSSIPNATRRSIKEKIGAPNLSATACPSIDKLVKSRLSAATKSLDIALAKQQALMLDCVGLITSILEDAVLGQLTPKSAMEAAQTALKLLGNASMNANRERWKNIIQDLNPNLVEMAEDNKVFSNAAPWILGDDFAKKAKERDEELKSLSQAIKRPHSSRPLDGKFFSGGRPPAYNNKGYRNHGLIPQSGGGQNYQGKRGGHQPYRSHPYQKRGSTAARYQDNRK